MEGHGVVNPGDVLTIVVRFEGYTGRYVFHCHMLEHEDNDMMRPYEVVPVEALRAELRAETAGAAALLARNIEPAEQDASRRSPGSLQTQCPGSTIQISEQPGPR